MKTDLGMRIGIALDACDVPAWQAAAVSSIRRLEFAVIVLFVLVHRRGQKPGRPTDDVMRRIEGHGKQGLPDALATVQLEVAVEGNECLAYVPSTEAADARVGGEIRARALDALIAFVDPGVFGDCGPLARLGLWFLDAGHGPLSPANGGQVGLKEVLNREQYLTTNLRVRQFDDPVDAIAYTTCSAVHPRSHHLTRNEHLWKCSAFAARALERCHLAGPEKYLGTLPAASRGFSPWSEVSRYASLVSYLGWRAWQKIAGRRVQERWILLRGSQRPSVKVGEVEPLLPPDGRFWADPHAIADDGVEYVYFEDASCRTGKGHVSLMTRHADGNFSAPIPVLERPYHLSYPFVFPWKGEYFMIPESAENRTIELYRCTRFPDQWTFVQNLKEGIRAYDATLVEHEDRWWMFANVVERDGASSWDELCIFYADSPLSLRWQSHRSNPVISDVRRARPAGPFIRKNGALLRPSQDSSGRYGRALHINRVEELNENSYRESTLSTISPDPRASLYAVHSLSSAGAAVYLDAIRRERK